MVWCAAGVSAHGSARSRLDWWPANPNPNPDPNPDPNPNPDPDPNPNQVSALSPRLVAGLQPDRWPGLTQP